jgi:hypothetical protein
MTETADPEDRESRLAMIAAEGERWRTLHGTALSALAPGTSVIIDITTGEYVTAADWHAARRAFADRFGDVGRPRFSFDVDRPIFIGGGLWRK